MKELGERLRILWDSVKLSQVKMAELLAVKQSSINRYDSARYKNILKKNGVKVISARENISEGIILEAMLEGYAEYYSAELSEKVIRGLTDNALKCKYNGGTVPMGYYIDEQQYYQIDPKTAPVVLEMFTRYSKDATMQELVNLLNSRGMRPIRGGKSR